MSANKTNTTMDDDFLYAFLVHEHLQFVIIAIVIVFVNVFAISLFAFKRNLRKCPNFLLVSHSFSDLLTGLVGLPLILVCSTTPGCVSCILSTPFMVFTSTSTVLHILVITYERFIKIVFPFKSKFADTKGELKAIGIVWFISLVFALVPLTWSPLSNDACFGEEPLSVKRKTKIYIIFQLVFFLGIPLVLIVIADVCVFVVVRRQLERIQGTSLTNNDQNTHERVKKETKVIAIMAAMMVYFVVCWSFYYTLLVMEALSIEEFELIPLWLEESATVIRTSTSFVNPILYVLLKHDFRQALARELRRLLVCSRHCRRRRHSKVPLPHVKYVANEDPHPLHNHTEGMFFTTTSTPLGTPTPTIKNNRTQQH